MLGTTDNVRLIYRRITESVASNAHLTNLAEQIVDPMILTGLRLETAPSPVPPILGTLEAHLVAYYVMCDVHHEWNGQSFEKLKSTALGSYKELLEDIRNGEYGDIAGTVDTPELITVGDESEDSEAPCNKIFVGDQFQWKAPTEGRKGDGTLWNG